MWPVAVATSSLTYSLSIVKTKQRNGKYDIMLQFKDILDVLQSVSRYYQRPQQLVCPWRLELL